MKLYIITADTCEQRYGFEISIFGIYDSLEKLENAIKLLRKEHDSFFFYDVYETTLNEINEIYLGGYYE